MKNIFIYPPATIKEALVKLNETGEKVLIVIDKDNKLLGTLTDGDIRRYILKTGTIEGVVEEIYNKNPIYGTEDESEKEIKDKIFKNKVEILPIIDNSKKVIRFYRWTDFYGISKKEKEKKLKDIPVVIMAGGKGTRLDPFTKVLPKPLLPIKDKTITEMIIDSFMEFGVNKFYLILNYKGKVIESYFNSIEKDYEINFVWEDEFLGTAGSLYLLKDIVKEDNFFVSNCDIVLDVNYNDVLEYHQKMNGTFTTITSIKHYKIPYGVVFTKEQGQVEKIEEKPEYIFQINTGVYLLSKESLKYIKPKTYLDMPHLINVLLENQKKVIAYPINEKNYLDVGQWEEYRNVLKILGD